VVAALACIGSGIAVVSFANPFSSALALIGNLGSLAVLYLLLSAEFVAAAQVLVYAGAVMVMFLFVKPKAGGGITVKSRLEAMLFASLPGSSTRRSRSPPGWRRLFRPQHGHATPCCRTVWIEPSSS
jgi:hypothetical protein